MGHPAYEARREAERVEAEERQVAAEISRAMMETFAALMTGRASLKIEPIMGAGGWLIRIVK